MNLKTKLKLYKKHVHNLDGLSPVARLTIVCLLDLKEGQTVTTNDLKEMMGYSQPTASVIAKKLMSMGMLEKMHLKTPYYWRFEDYIKDK